MRSTRLSENAFRTADFAVGEHDHVASTLSQYLRGALHTTGKLRASVCRHLA